MEQTDQTNALRAELAEQIPIQSRMEAPNDILCPKDGAIFVVMDPGSAA